MSHRAITLIDPSGTVVATAQVAEHDGTFAGSIDLSPMPADLRRCFEEFEEVVNGQMFGLLDDVEERIDSLSLRATLDETCRSKVEDLQIFPSSGRVSFRAMRGTAHRA